MRELLLWIVQKWPLIINKVDVCIHIYSLDELVVQEASFRLKEQLLQQEKHLIKSQNEWLSTELQTKSEQLLTLRKEQASTVSDLETRLSQKEEEVC